MELVLCGRTVSPREAAQLGIVTACVDGSVLDAAMSVAQEIASKPVLAAAHIKRLIGNAGMWDSEEAGFAEERTRFCDLMVSDDAIGRMSEMNAGHRDIRERRG
jgi:enoyl-CoA hydratase